MRSRTLWTGLFLGTLLLAACGDDAGGDTTTTGTPTTTTLSTTTTTSPPTTTTTGVTTTTAPPASTTTSGELPGEPIEFGPAAGDTLAVVGVAHDDALNLRAAPGADQRILDEIPPLHDALTALGHTRQLPGSLWIGVEFEGTQGWVNLRFVAYLGDTNDITAAVVEDLGERPGAETMEDLGLLIAERLAGDSSADIVMSVAPTVGDLGEVTFDVTGFEDDSVRGGRYHIFAEPIQEGFVLDAIEATPFCARGVEQGLCL